MDGGQAVRARLRLNLLQCVDSDSFQTGTHLKAAVAPSFSGGGAAACIGGCGPPSKTSGDSETCCCIESTTNSATEDCYARMRSRHGLNQLGAGIDMGASKLTEMYMEMRATIRQAFAELVPGWRDVATCGLLPCTSICCLNGAQARLHIFDVYGLIYHMAGSASIHHRLQSPAPCIHCESGSIITCMYVQIANVTLLHCCSNASICTDGCALQRPPRQQYRCQRSEREKACKNLCG